MRWKWWLSDEFRRELSLTPEQVERIDQVFQASLPSLQAGKRDLDRFERELSTVIADSAATEPQVLRDRSGGGVPQRAGTHAIVMLFRMSRVLTPEQRVRLTALHEKRERDHRTDLGGPK